MSKHMVVWIDHRVAQVVDVEHGAAGSVFIIESGMERRHRAMGVQGVPPPGHIGGDPEHTYDNRRRGELGRFLARVKRALRGADGIVVLGPGLAKTELHRVLSADRRMRGAVVGVMPAARMTTAQMLKRARPRLEADQPPRFRAEAITPRRSLRGSRT
ncbi:MAG: hypothetical protein IT436_15655 [Phycisphaerales bacterium]|nr:hypothetical protein [Phycisphaerales bacterium]